MTSPWTDMQADFWAYLQTKTAYTALGLTEFRFYDGNIVPQDIEQLLQSDRLPLICARMGAMGHEAFVEGQYYEYVTVPLAIMYRAAEGAASTAAIENAADVLLGILYNRAARGSNLGSSTIRQYELVPREIVPLLTNGQGPPRAYLWTGVLTLRGPRRIYN